MRDAIARAEVGDDVYGEDPSVIRLEERAATLTGKDAALFVPSGTMANQIAVRVHTEPGDALIAGHDAHLHLYEGGGAAALSGVHTVLVGEGGLFAADDVRGAIAPDDPHFARTRLVCIENTHNRSGGRIFPLEAQRAIAATARDHGLALHLDGARIFNASVATGLAVRELAAPFDSVAFCLSKGLGAPVGSLICGSLAFIARGRRVRKLYGGGMRQAGILAAAGLYALDHNVERLADDHENARTLAARLEDGEGLCIERPPETNMVLIGVAHAGRFVSRLAEHGVALGAVGPRTLRAVTHLDVTASDVERAADAIREVATEA
jgi:threonine aldolase